MKMDEDPDYVSFIETSLPRRESRIVTKRPDGVYLPVHVKNRDKNPSLARKPKRKREKHDSRTKEDLEYASYLNRLSTSGKARIVEKRPDCGYFVCYPRNKQTNPRFERKPKRKRVELDCSTKEVLRKPGGERARHEPDSAQLRKRQKEKKGGLREENPVFKGSEGRVYDSDYFTFLSHVKVLENGMALETEGGVIVRYAENVDTVHESAVHNNVFDEKGRENMVGNNALVQERMEKVVCLKLEERGKTVKGDALPEGVDKFDKIGPLGIASPSLKKSVIQSENDSVIAQVVGCAEVSVKTGNRMEVKKQKVVENGSQKANECEEMKIDPGQASHQSEPVPTHLQAFMSLMKKLCPDKAIYSGFSGNEVLKRPMVEPSSQNLEKKPNQDEKKETSKSSPRSFFDFDWIEGKGEEEELPANKSKFRCKGNRRGRTEMIGLVGYPDISDTDEEPQIDDIPEKILGRSPSDYKERLIEELRRPYDRSEYRELMIKATIRKRKIIEKQLRSGKERAMETNEESKSFFDWYPELRSKVERAERGRRLTLLRGFFFWLMNCCCKDSFKPWEKGVKSSNIHHSK